MSDRPPSPPPKSQPPTNYRELHRQTQRNLLIGGLVILFLVGGGLVWLLYGAEQALTAVLCMGGGLAVFGGLYWLVSKLLKFLSKSDDE